MTGVGPDGRVARYVEGVARAYGAASVVADAEYGGGPAVRLIPTPASAGEGDAADLAVSIDAPARGTGWPEHLAAMGKLARKALVVVVANAERARLPGERRPLAVVELAGVLWRIGRVRERVYLGVPALPGAPGDGAAPFPAGFFVRHTARLQGFVVDTAPRTPQARRRLRTVAARGTVE